MRRKRVARDYFSMKSARYRRVLELAMTDLPRYERKKLRAIFLACQNLHFIVPGYRNQLEYAIKFIKRAEKAIKALENDDEN